MFTGIVQELGIVRSVQPDTLIVGVSDVIREQIELRVSQTRGSDGHLVLGPIDALGRVQVLYQEDAGWTLIVEFPSQYRRLIAEEGSIAVEGISLTSYDSDGGSSRRAIIPDTCERAVLKDRRCGRSVNFEFDIQAEYVERMIRFVHSD